MFLNCRGPALQRQPGGAISILRKLTSGLYKWLHIEKPSLYRNGSLVEIVQEHEIAVESVDPSLEQGAATSQK